MNQIIVYGSEYGTTKRYAEKLSQLSGIDAIGYEDVKTLQTYSRIIYLGGLYAGGVKGLKRTVKLIPPAAKLLLVTVGLADVTDPENIRNIRQYLLATLFNAPVTKDSYYDARARRDRALGFGRGWGNE